MIRLPQHRNRRRAYLVGQRNKLFFGKSGNSVQMDLPKIAFNLTFQIESCVRAGDLSHLKRIGLGLNNREIAAKLFLSEGTVRNYLSSILEKLQLRDRTQIAVLYYRHR